MRRLPIHLSLKSEYHRQAHLIDKCLGNRTLLQILATQTFKGQWATIDFLAAAERNVIRRVMGGW